MGGTIIKFLGDGHLITFDSVFDAVRAGRYMQRQIAQHNQTHPETEQIHLRIGIDAGDVSVNASDNDVVGNAADLAKRVESEATPGEVVLSERAYRLVRPGYMKCEPYKESVLLKGDTRPITLYRVTSCEAEDPMPRQRLAKQLGRNFLQVLLPKFVIQYKNGQRHLTVEVTHDLETVTSSEERAGFYKEQKERLEARAALTTTLNQVFIDGSSGYQHPVHCEQWPLRYANGGVLPILETNQGMFFCLFYRDKFPEGWNISNGSSDTIEEMLEPERIIRREFGEELLIACENDHLFMAHDPGKESKSVGFQNAAIAAWSKQFPGRGYQNYRLTDFPEDRIVWVNGPDKVTAIVLGQCQSTSGIFVSVTPEDNAIEVDRIARVKLDTEFQCLDGEMSVEKPVGRIVGLFECQDVERNLHQNHFLPDRLFFEGLERDPHTFDNVLNEYRSKCSTVAIAQQDRVMVNLCPLTRALLTRYFSVMRKGM